MKVNYLYEAGPFGSYKNAKQDNKAALQKLASEAIFEKHKEDIMEVYVNDIVDFMDATKDSAYFGGTTAKYRICNRYINDESPNTYGVGARIYLRGNTVIIEQLLSSQTSLISGTLSKLYYTCPEELTFWEKEEKKLQEMFPRYTFKIMLDWVYNSTERLWARKKVNSDVDNLEHHPFPYNTDIDGGNFISIGENVTLEMFIKYWNRFISRSKVVKSITLNDPSMDSLDITVPTDFKVETIQIIGGENLVDINGAAKYLVGNKQVLYNLNGFRSFSPRKSDSLANDIEDVYKQKPAFEKATNGVLSLDNLIYLFDKSPDGRLLFSYFTYDINTGKGLLFDDSTYNHVANWFDKDGFKKAVDDYIKKQGKK